MRISFIGGGNMASALVGGLIRQGRRPQDIQVVEPDASARGRLAANFGIGVSDTPDETVLGCEVLVLAVKPQQMQAAITPLAGRLTTQVVVSIAAGTRLASIAQWLGGYARLVRAMPNTPALIGEGLTGLFADPLLTEAERALAQEVLAAVGPTLWVNDENQIDAVTAISGSGPAYVFHFIEALEAAATQLGFAPDAARTLALQTVRGSALLAHGSADSPAILREKVTSKGGTTEAALKVMSEAGLVDIIVRAAQAAYDRGQALGKGA